MARFNINPDLKSYSRYFGRGLLILAAVLVVAGLVLGTFFYGDRQRQDNQTTNLPAGQAGQAENQAAAPAGEVQVENQTPAETQAPGTSVQSTPNLPTGQAGQNTTPPAPSAPSTIPAGGPSQIPSTGAEDWILPITLGLSLLAYRFRRSRQTLATAQLNI